MVRLEEGNAAREASGRAQHARDLPGGGERIGDVLEDGVGDDVIEDRVAEGQGMGVAPHVGAAAVEIEARVATAERGDERPILAGAAAPIEHVARVALHGENREMPAIRARRDGAVIVRIGRGDEGRPRPRRRHPRRNNTSPEVAATTDIRYERPMPSPADSILGWLRTAHAPLSGEALAGRLGISRAAVFKHVEALRARGYVIASEHARGYVLSSSPDRLDAIELGPHLRGSWRRIEWHAEVDSTQRVARELAHDGAEEGTIVIAEAQTAGRGRLGRTWHSPPGANLYCSIILRPALAPDVVPQVALVAGLGVAEAIEGVGLAAALKWPNDVLVGGRKVVGILTEMEAELERVRVVIIGIGVNVNAQPGDFPPYLRDKATSLAIAAGRPIDRLQLTARMLASLERVYGRFLDGGFPALRDEWNRRAALTGRQVTVTVSGTDVAGEVVGIDEDGALRLVDRTGGVHRILAGEVTIAALDPA